MLETFISHRLRRRPVARMIDRTFGLRAWALACLGAAIVGGLLFWITPFKLPQAMVMALIAGAAGTLGEFVMTALKRDAGVNYWGNTGPGDRRGRACSTASRRCASRRPCSSTRCAGTSS